MVCGFIVVEQCLFHMYIDCIHHTVEGLQILTLAIFVCLKDLKQQNQYQVFERQLDESRCTIQELQRENTTLKKQLKER